MFIQVKLDDPCVGSYNAEGALTRPLKSVDGKPYVLAECNLHYFDHADRRYVVAVPATMPQDITIVILEDEPPTEPEQPPVEPKPRKKGEVDGQSGN